MIAIGIALVGADAPTIMRRGRSYRDYSTVVRGGESCRAMVDVALAEALTTAAVALEAEAVDAGHTRYAGGAS